MVSVLCVISFFIFLIAIVFSVYRKVKNGDDMFHIPALFALITVFLILLNLITIHKENDKTEIIKVIEQAYFEGQRDYANGDVRIKFTKDSCWVWSKSPWDNGATPVFNPSVIHSK